MKRADDSLYGTRLQRLAVSQPPLRPQPPPPFRHSGNCPASPRGYRCPKSGGAARGFIFNSMQFSFGSGSVFRCGLVYTTAGLRIVPIVRLAAQARRCGLLTDYIRLVPLRCLRRLHIWSAEAARALSALLCCSWAAWRVRETANLMTRLSSEICIQPLLVELSVECCK